MSGHSDQLQWDLEHKPTRMMVPRKWTCGHCGASTSTELGVGCAPFDALRHIRAQRMISEPTGQRVSVISSGNDHERDRWLAGDRFRFGAYFCSGCLMPTVFLPDGSQIPDAIEVPPIKGLPHLVEQLFEEIRRCMRVSAYTSAMMASRKILMNVAVEQGAPQNQNFTQYVDYLIANGFVPPNAKPWVDKIRKIGNQSTHEIPSVSKDDALLVISFADALLRVVYGFPFMASGAASAASGSTSTSP